MMKQIYKKCKQNQQGIAMLVTLLVWLKSLKTIKHIYTKETKTMLIFIKTNKRTVFCLLETGPSNP